MSRRFRFKAIYKDGRVLREVEPSGVKNSYDDLSHDGLVAFELWDTIPHGESCEYTHKLFRVSLTSKDDLIWRPRLERDERSNELKEVAHIIGKKEHGVNRQWVIVIFESDGRIEAAEKFDPNHPWLYPFGTLRPHERWEM